LLLKAKNEGCNAFLYGKSQVSTVIKNEKRRIFGDPYATFSVFAIGSSATGVTIKGAKYEADGVTLEPDFPLGVSNSFTDPGYADIEVECGALLIMQAI
jgi:thiamine pyrophosphokinase